MRIGMLIDVEKPVEAVVTEVARFAVAGFDSTWASQIFGYDALTLIAAVGQRVPGIQFGTGVVPVYPRHPQMLAQQALTVQAVTGGRLTLGIGLSHQMVIEGMWGMSFERPARYMREYLSILAPLLKGEVVHQDGEVLTTHTFAPLGIPDAPAPTLLVAALGPAMLKIAGELSDGTVTWMTGVGTIGEHIVPGITKSAHAAGRPAPRIAASLPVTVSTDLERAREQINKVFAIYPNLPSYKAMLDKEGAAEPADIAFIGSEEQVTEQIMTLENAGATDFIAAVVGNREERQHTEELLASLAKR